MDAELKKEMYVCEHGTPACACHEAGYADGVSENYNSSLLSDIEVYDSKLKLAQALVESLKAQLAILREAAQGIPEPIAIDDCGQGCLCCDWSSSNFDITPVHEAACSWVRLRNALADTAAAPWVPVHEAGHDERRV